MSENYRWKQNFSNCSIYLFSVSISGEVLPISRSTQFILQRLTHCIFFPYRSPSQKVNAHPLLYCLLPDIHCLRTSNVETFTAFLRVPDGFGTVPVLENSRGRSSGSDPTLCLITRTNIDKVMALDISHMEQCGVRQCQPSSSSSYPSTLETDEVDSSWMCVTVRFPMLPGLKMPEDEVIDIKCKPQDHAIAGSNVINFQENE